MKEGEQQEQNQEQDEAGSAQSADCKHINAT